MNLFRICVLVVLGLAVGAGCAPKSDDDPANAENAANGANSVNSSTNGATNNTHGTPDGFDTERITLAPEECVADLEVIGSQDVEERDHPLVHKGDFFGYGEVDGASALVSMTTGDPLVVAGQPVPDRENETLTFFSFRFEVAPDIGDAAEPDYPVVMTATADNDENFNRRSVVIYASPNAAPRYGIGAQDTVAGDAGGVIETISEMRLDAYGSLFARVSLEGIPGQSIIKQAGPGRTPTVVLYEGQSLPTGFDDTVRFVETIEAFKTDTWGGILARVKIGDGAEGDGTAWLSVDPFTGIVQCRASTSFAIICNGGIQLNDQKTLDPLEFDASGGTAAGVVSTGESVELEYVFAGQGTTQTIARDDEVSGMKILDFRRVRVCESTGDIYVATYLQQVEQRRMGWELLRVRQDGSVEPLTNFMAFRDSAFHAEVPDEIRDFSLGYHCDAVIYGWGPSREDTNQGYEGYWAVYADGDTVEILDDTPGRDTDYGDFVNTARARSGIDPYADEDELVYIGPDGEFYFVGVFTRGGVKSWDYTVATEPRNRCREPLIVTTETDAPDSAPGDGRCDTGDGECSLRAALEEANALRGSDEITFDGVTDILLEQPLPPITSILELNGEGVAIDGGQLQGDAVGLDIQVDSSVIRGLALDGFPSHGLRATEPVRLENVSLTDNCGWGASFENLATLTGTDGTRISGNGVADGCEGGGISSTIDLSRTTELRLRGIEISENGGPGILAAGTVAADDLEIRGNQGDGILLPLFDGGFVESRLNAWLSGNLRIHGNRGHGVHVVGGDIWANRVSLDIQQNCGWGIYLDGGTLHAYRALDGNPHIVSENGYGANGRFWDVDAGTPVSREDVCGGGGVAILDVDANRRDGLVKLQHATVAGNQGPGIATTDFLEVSDVEITGNSGPGVIFGEIDGVGREEIVVAVRGAENRFDFNLGAGIRVESGSISVKGNSHISDNHGAGVHAESGDVYFNTPAESFVTEVRRNGGADLHCKPWALDDEGWAGAALAPCVRRDGVVAEDGNIEGLWTIITDNGGAGYVALDPDDEGFGVVTFDGAQICANGEVDVASTANLTNPTACP